jgi:hypothetical protein
MADEAARIRAALACYEQPVDVAKVATLVDTLRAVVDRCVLLSQSDYPARAGVAVSILRDVERELGVQGAHQVPVFEPQELPGEVRDAASDH